MAAAPPPPAASDGVAGAADAAPPWGWEAWYTSAAIAAAFALMLLDLAKPDLALLGALALILATTDIVTVQEGLEGFSNQGLLTVGVLFAVAAGINNTGGLDYTMGRILGAPGTAAAAQFRLMVPVAVVSAFLNNTPVVAILIPIVKQWAARIRLAPGQLFIPLSYASILGGTCTLIGTSTNLVVAGLYEQRLPGQSIGIFDLSPYGVPVMLSGLAYVLAVSPWLLVGGARRSRSGAAGAEGADEEDAKGGGGDELVVAARVRPTSPVVGRTVAEGGLRGLPGLYLISVRRGDMLVRAVGPEFVVADGDVLHFTGLAEKLGEVAAAYGLEPLHHEHDHDVDDSATALSLLGSDLAGDKGWAAAADVDEGRGGAASHAWAVALADAEAPQERAPLCPGSDGYYSDGGAGVMRRRHSVRSDANSLELGVHASSSRAKATRRAARYASSEGTVDGYYGPHTDERSDRPPSPPSSHDASSVRRHQAGASVASLRHMPPPGLRMARAAVRPGSSLEGKAPRDVGFRRRYGAAILALVRRGEQLHGVIGQTPLMAGDVIVMQVSLDSPLLELINGDLPEPQPEPGSALPRSRWSLNRLTGSFGSLSAAVAGGEKDGEAREGSASPGGDSEADAIELSEVTVRDGPAVAADRAAASERQTRAPDAPASLAECHVDLKIVQNSGGVERDFMIAMRVAPGSPIIGKTVQAAGLRGLPGLFLASIERHPAEEAVGGAWSGGERRAGDGGGDCVRDDDGGVGGVSAAAGDEEAPPVDAPATPSIVVADRDDKLRAGDVLWFSGELQSVAALRRVPGLVPLEDHQLSKLKVVKAERRLVQAVLAQRSELVGRTAKDSRFRTRYDAVIIAVHRAGERVHHQIGAIRFQPGDVLLLDTGPGFMRAHGKDPAFALVSEIRDSMPPRFHLLYVAGAAAAAMIALAVANVLPLFTSALLAAGVMVCTGCLTQEQVRESVNWQVIVTIATAFGLSNAMQNAGIAGNLAKWMVDGAEATGTGETGLLVAIQVGTIVLANVVGNNAAAALMFPIAADAAVRGGTDLLNMSFNVMLAASASFASPFGYQTNLMVYGAGGYRFADFVRFGGPMQLWQLVVSVLVLVVGQPGVFILWGVTGGLVLFLVFGSTAIQAIKTVGVFGWLKQQSRPFE